MNAGLVYLLRAGPRCGLRDLRQRFSGKKGVFLLVGILAFLAMMIGPQILVYFSHRDPERLQRNAEFIRRYVPPGLLLMTVFLTMAGGLHFKPSEIQFLFPAPISRKQLLLYHVLSRLRIQILSGLWIGIFVLGYAGQWYSAIIAPILVMAFMQLTVQCSGLLIVAVGERIAKPVRKVGCFVVLLAIAAAAFASHSYWPDESIMAKLKAMVDVPAVKTVSWVTRPFVEVFVADSVAFVGVWAAVCLGILSVLFVFLMALDVAYEEGAVAHARAVQEALQRARTGGGTIHAKKRKILQVPRFPHWNGAGPIAWRQTQELTRNYMSVLVLAFLMMIWIIIACLRYDNLVTPIATILAVTPFLTTSTAFDFRRDFDRMTVLKALPLSAMAISLGQLIPTTILLCVIEGVMLTVTFFLRDDFSADVFTAILIALVPLNWIISGVENLIFLLLPYRVTGTEPGQFGFMGRFMLVMLLKVIALGAVCSLSAGGGFLVYEYVVSSYIAVGVTIALLFAGFAYPITAAVAAAFKRFDVTQKLD